MMTTMAALLGGIPLAVGSGIGSELRRPLGICMVGGLLLSQALTLYTTPVIYIFFDQFAQRFSRKRRRPAELRPAEENHVMNPSRVVCILLAQLRIAHAPCEAGARHVDIAARNPFGMVRVLVLLSASSSSPSTTATA